MHTHKLNDRHTFTFLKGTNNSTPERGVWGAVWHIAGTNLPAARGSAEWTQLGGWFGARAGAPWRQTDTAKKLRQRKSLQHTNTKMYILTHSPFAFTILSFTSLSRKGGFMSRICHPRMPAAAPVDVCTFVFVFWHLSPCSLCMSLLCPSHWQGQPAAPDGPPTKPTYTPFVKVDLVKWHFFFAQTAALQS